MTLMHTNVSTAFSITSCVQYVSVRSGSYGTFVAYKLYKLITKRGVASANNLPHVKIKQFLYRFGHSLRVPGV